MSLLVLRAYSGSVTCGTGDSGIAFRSDPPSENDEPPSILFRAEVVDASDELKAILRDHEISVQLVRSGPHGPAKTRLQRANCHIFQDGVDYNGGVAIKADLPSFGFDTIAHALTAGSPKLLERLVIRVHMSEKPENSSATLFLVGNISMSISEPPAAPEKRNSDRKVTTENLQQDQIDTIVAGILRAAKVIAVVGTVLWIIGSLLQRLFR
jgi:hypothetical protein